MHLVIGMEAFILPKKVSVELMCQIYCVEVPHYDGNKASIVFSGRVVDPGSVIRTVQLPTKRIADFPPLSVSQAIEVVREVSTTTKQNFVIFYDHVTHLGAERQQRPCSSGFKGILWTPVAN